MMNLFLDIIPSGFLAARQKLSQGRSQGTPEGPGTGTTANILQCTYRCCCCVCASLDQDAKSSRRELSKSCGWTPTALNLAEEGSGSGGGPLPITNTTHDRRSHKKRIREFIGRRGVDYRWPNNEKCLPQSTQVDWSPMFYKIQFKLSPGGDGSGST